MLERWVDRYPHGVMDAYEAALYLGIAKNTLGVYCGFGLAPDCYRLARRYPGPRGWLKGDLDRWLMQHPDRGNPPGGRPKPGARLPAPPKVEEVPPRPKIVRRRPHPRPAAEREAAYAARRRTEPCG